MTAFTFQQPVKREEVARNDYKRQFGHIYDALKIKNGIFSKRKSKQNQRDTMNRISVDRVPIWQRNNNQSNMQNEYGQHGLSQMEGVSPVPSGDGRISLSNLGGELHANQVYYD